MITLTMDPGDNTALTIWLDGELVTSFFWRLSARDKKSLSTTQKHAKLCLSFQNVLKEEVKHLHSLSGGEMLFIIEGVSLWGSSTKSQASALRGDSFRLAYLVGGYISIFQELFSSSEVEIIDVRKWKGSLPTDILEKEVERFTQETPENEHLACAIGIGMNHFGRL